MANEKKTIQFQVGLVIANKLYDRLRPIWIYGSSPQAQNTWYCVKCATSRFVYSCSRLDVAARIAREGLPTNCVGCYKSFKDIVGEL